MKHDETTFVPAEATLVEQERRLSSMLREALSGIECARRRVDVVEQKLWREVGSALIKLALRVESHPRSRVAGGNAEAIHQDKP